MSPRFVQGIAVYSRYDILTASITLQSFLRSATAGLHDRRSVRLNYNKNGASHTWAASLCRRY